MRYSRPAARFSARRRASATSASRSSRRRADRAPEPGGRQLERHPLVRGQRPGALERQLERADRAEPVLDVELEPLRGGGPRGIARHGAEAVAAVERERRGLAPNAARIRSMTSSTHLAGGQRVDRRVEDRPELREQRLPLTALRAGPRRPLHSRGSVPGRRRAVAPVPSPRGPCACGPTVVESRAMPSPRLALSAAAAAAALAFPAAAAAVAAAERQLPRVDDASSRSRARCRGVHRHGGHDRGDHAADTFNPNRDGQPFGGGDPEPTSCGAGQPAFGQHRVVGLQAAERRRRADQGVRRLRGRRRGLRVERADVAHHAARALPERGGRLGGRAAPGGRRGTNYTVQVGGLGNTGGPLKLRRSTTSPTPTATACSTTLDDCAAPPGHQRVRRLPARAARHAADPLRRHRRAASGSRASRSTTCRAARAPRSAAAAAAAR